MATSEAPAGGHDLQFSSLSYETESRIDNSSAMMGTVLFEAERPGGVEVIQEWCGPFQFYLNAVIIGVLCCLGIVGNSISIFVLQKDRHNRVAVFLLQSLAIADNSVLCIAFIVLSLFYGGSLAAGKNEQFNSRLFLIKYINPLGYIAQSVVIWLTVLLAVNRFVAICRPFAAKRWLKMAYARIQVAVVVVVSVLWNIPRVFTIADSQPRSGNTTNSSTDASVGDAALPRSSLGKNWWFAVFYMQYLYSGIVLILPLLLLICLNASLIRQMQRSKRSMKRNSLSYTGTQENSITLVMVVIIAELVICHATDRVVMIVRSIMIWRMNPNDAIKCPNGLFFFVNIANLLVIINSSTDFIVYYVCRRRFRRILCEKLFCRTVRRGSNQSSVQSEAANCNVVGNLDNRGSLTKLHKHHCRRLGHQKMAADDDGPALTLRDRYRLSKKRDSNQICLLKLNNTHM